MELAATAKGRKTWMALDLARCVATGGMFLETFQCAKGRVLYFDYELPAEGMDFRVSVAMGHDAAAGVEFYSLRHNPDIGTVEAIRAEVEASKPDLVIVDCLYAVPGAPVEENSNSEAAAFRRLFVAMAESTNTAFLLLHHTGKGAGIGRDVRDRGRGASSSAAVVDTVASIIPDGGGADFLQFEAVARSFRPMEESPLVVSFCTEDEPWRFIPTGTVPQSATPGQPRKSGADVLAAIMPGGSTKEQILEALGRAGTSMSEKTLRNRLADLEAAGDVRFTQTGKGLKTYFRA
jgi:hypothetical protein